MDSRARSCVVPLAGAVLGAAFFAWIAGVQVLDPRSFGWTMKLDWRIHFLGWHFFRGEPWHWPPGLIEGYYHAPSGTAIGFTDSIPLAAFALKPFAAWLPMPFQYLGAWMLGCLALQGLFGVLLARVWTRKVALQMLAAALFVLMPTLLMRVGHPALCAHWLILWALWLYLRTERDVPPAAGTEGVLGLIAGLVHPYLALMVLAILAALAVRVIAADWRRRAVAAAAGFAAAVSGVLVAWWAAGLFSVSVGRDLTSEGLGKYSMNLLAPITPTGWSQFLPEWPLGAEGQAFEGFQYMGAGALALLLVAAVLAWRAGRGLPWRALMPLLAVAIACAVYALSPRVTLGDIVLTDIHGAWLEPFAVFRSTGRFYWPLGYLLLAASVAIVVTRLPPAAAGAVLLAAVVLQAVDLHGAHAERWQTSRDPAFLRWDMPLTSAFWGETLPHYDHFVIVRPEQCGRAPIGFEAPAYLAGLYGLTVNAGQVARHDEVEHHAYCDGLLSDVRDGRLDDRSLYLGDDSLAATLGAQARTPARCWSVDGMTACVTERSLDSWRLEVPGP